MRDNSGSGKSQNNDRNPTLEEHQKVGGHTPARPPGGAEAAVGGNARQRGEDPSPDNRRRGETAISDRAAPADVDRKG